MILGLEFVIYATIMVFCLLPLYIYREKIFKSQVSQIDDFSLFIKDVKLHMIKYYPKIKINYSIIEKTKNEQNIKLRENLIIEDIVEQFFNYEYKIKTQETVSRDKLWVGYDEKSISTPKLPSDWQQRKEIAWRRENKSCSRCGQLLINLNDAHTIFVRQIKDGGGFNLENIVILCSDCNKIVNSTNEKNTIHSLLLNDKLMLFVRD